MDRDIKPENLYETIEKILEIGAKISALQTNPQIGDPLSVEYNRLLDSLPQIFSVSDLIKYHQYLIKVKEGQTVNVMEKARENILSILEKSCSSQALVQIRDVVK